MSKEKQVGDYLVGKDGKRTYNPRGNPERYITVSKGGINEDKYLAPHAYTDSGREIWTDT